MSSNRLLRFRLLLNGCACVVLAAGGLLVAFSVASGLGGLTPGSVDDPDAAKSTGVVIISMCVAGVVAVASIISLIRTVRTWRQLDQDDTKADRSA